MNIVKKNFLPVLLCAILILSGLPVSSRAVDRNSFPDTSITFSVGDQIEFGSYPQSEVKDKVLIEALNAMALDYEDWTSYGYFSGTGNALDGTMSAKDYMRYSDVNMNGTKYRGVRFTKYRPSFTGFSASADGQYSYQDENGYYINTTYWFKFEPLIWRLLDPKTGLMLSEKIVDSQPVNNHVYAKRKDSDGGFNYYGNADATFYTNNYAESSLRQKLGGSEASSFLNTAFSPPQVVSLLDTYLDNSAYRDSDSEYDAVSTVDKVFLLSCGDIINTEYGFHSDTIYVDKSRMTQGSDYAKCQGLEQNEYQSVLYSSWRLRTPCRDSTSSYVVSYGGSLYNYKDSYATYYGVRPAIRVNLDAFVSDFKYHFDANGGHFADGASTAELECRKGDTFFSESFEQPVRDGYVFAGWCPELPKTRPNGDFLSYALWKPEHPHTTEIIDVKEPTCLEPGFSGTVYCSICQEILSDGEILPALGHCFEKTPNIQPATCTESGKKELRCMQCGFVQTEILSAQGHVYDGEGVVTKSPTCTEQGMRKVVCTVCQQENTEPIEALGHSRTQTKVKSEPTCDQPGTLEVTCYCGYSWNEVIPKNGHDYKGKIIRPATCTEAGEIVFTCSGCLDSYTQTIQKKDHILVLEKIVPVSCTEDGYTLYVCQSCHNPFKQDIVPALGHSYEKNVTAPTCTQPGYTTYLCTACTDQYTAEPVPATGHKYVETVTNPTHTERGYITHTCSVCQDSYVDSYVDPLPVEGRCGTHLTWVLKTDTGVLTISGKGTMTDYLADNQPWKNYQAYVKEIVVENGVTTIGSHAFMDCSQLKKIHIPKSLQTIGADAFEKTSLLNDAEETFVLDDFLIDVGDAAGIYTVPKNIKRIAQGAFSHTDKITAFVVEPGNTAFLAEKGVLFDAEGTTLICYPTEMAADKYTIPSRVTAIEYAAFHHSKLRNLLVTANVQRIEEDAFLDCPGTMKIGCSRGSVMYDYCQKHSIPYYTQVTVTLKNVEADPISTDIFSKLVFPAEPHRIDAYFNCWTDEEGNPFSEGITLTEDISLYARWVPLAFPFMNYDIIEDKSLFGQNRVSNLYRSVYGDHWLNSTFAFKEYTKYGVCFGISSASMLLFNDSTYRASGLWNLQKDDEVFLSENNRSYKLRSLIEQMHVSQHSRIAHQTIYPLLRIDEKNNKTLNSEGLGAIKKVLNSGNLVRIRIRNSKQTHSLVAYRLQEDAAAIRIYVYDCDYLPTAAPYILIHKDDHSWEYILQREAASGFGSTGKYEIIEYQFLDAIDCLYQNLGNLEYYADKQKTGKSFFVTNSDYFYLNENGETIASYQDGVLSTQREDIIQVCLDGDLPNSENSEKLNIFYLPVQGSDTIEYTISDSSHHDELFVELYDCEYGARVTTQAHTVVFDVNDQNKSATVTIHNPNQVQGCAEGTATDYDVLLMSDVHDVEYTGETSTPVTLSLKQSQVGEASLDVQVETSADGKKHGRILCTENEAGQNCFLFCPDIGYAVADVRVNDVSCGPITQYDEWNETDNLDIYVRFTEISLPQIISGPITLHYMETRTVSVSPFSLPSGARVEWRVEEGSGVQIEPDGWNCKITSVKSGTVRVTMRIVDENGEVLADKNGNEMKSKQIVQSKAGLFWKIAAWFKKIFKINF